MCAGATRDTLVWTVPSVTTGTGDTHRVCLVQHVCRGRATRGLVDVIVMLGGLDRCALCVRLGSMGPLVK